MLTLDELKMKMEAEQKAIKDKYAEKLAAAHKREQKAKAREMKKIRAIENHGKYVLAGYMLAEFKKKGSLSTLKACLASLTNEREKEAIQYLISSLSGKPEASESSSQESQS